MVQFGDPFAKDIKEVLVTGPTAAPIATLDDLAGGEIFAGDRAAISSTSNR
jgi:hypothetical protein